MWISVEKSVAEYQALLETYPEDGTALNDLALAYNILGRYPEAEQAAERAIGALPGASQPYGEAAAAQVVQGKFTRAESTLAEMRRALPRARRPELTYAAVLAAVRGDYGRAVAYDDSALQLAGDDPAARASSNDRLADLAALRGRLAQAAAYRQQALRADQERELPRAVLGEAIALATIDVRFRDAPAAAAARLDTALAQTPLNTLSPPDRPDVRLAQVYAEAGRPGVARRLLAEYERTVDEWFRLQQRGDSAALAEVALAEGRAPEAIATLRAFVTGAGPRCAICGLFELARAYDRAGQRDSALVYYERFATLPPLRPPAGVPWSSLPQAYKRLGELYEEKGDRAKALEYYGKFVDLWKDADPELQPVVRDVRQRMARLAGER